jgi:hypothetical protein
MRQEINVREESGTICKLYLFSFLFFFVFLCFSLFFFVFLCFLCFSLYTNVQQKSLSGVHQFEVRKYETLLSK